MHILNKIHISSLLSSSIYTCNISEITDIVRKKYTDKTTNLLGILHSIRTIHLVKNNETLQTKSFKASLSIEDISKLPQNVQAAYLEPLRHPARYGIITCSLQMRSFEVPRLAFFADFSMRVAYYLGLPASGPVPLPKRIERWTVPRGPFIHTKSKENFERITHKRLITIKDGHPRVVEIWLAYLKKHAMSGVGMKANVFHWEPMEKKE
ncbi:ribosomal protein S10 [Pneumocystis murina B123]|uniref:Small ribosomal subunit protein uS10m n=1 Tax=Pneumocystis murina (strain B123) TaxID=1069680 RepID=M7P4G9_PNEMU|nr:ribosomal protein S10 [Pneumocystis murina B123]EMR08730.1 ribosomal protein S10 [Pneumocystis murina B123]